MYIIEQPFSSNAMYIGPRRINIEGGGRQGSLLPAAERPPPKKIGPGNFCTHPLAPLSDDPEKIFWKNFGKRKSSSQTRPVAR